jgi:DNA polymerase-3 subunit delta
MKNIYLLYGEEKYDMNVRLEKIKKEFGNLENGVNLFHLNSENIDTLESVCQGVTFFGNKKLIIIKDTKLKFDIEILDNLDEEIKVVILEDSVDKRTSSYKVLQKKANCEEFKHLDSAKMISYITTILKNYGLNISYEVAEYIQSICGEDKTNNINEIQKIVLYLQKGDTVTKEIVDIVCTKTLNAKIFDLLANIVNKKKDLAIKELNELLKQKEPIVKIYIMLYKQIKQMYMIKYLINKKININDIATQLQIHPYTFKNLSKSSQNYTLEKLKQIIYDFDEYDERTKIGDMDFEIGLKKIILKM